MKRNPVTADSKASEVKTIARNLYDVGIQLRDLEEDYYKMRIGRLFNIPESDWNAVKECIGWWFLDFEKGGSL